VKVNKNRCLITVNVINEVEALQAEQEIRVYAKKHYRKLPEKYLLQHYLVVV